MTADGGRLLLRLSRTARADNTRLSTILGVQDEWDAYCIDEVAQYVVQRVQNGDELLINKNEDDVMSAPTVSSMSDFYKSLGVTLNG